MDTLTSNGTVGWADLNLNEIAAGLNSAPASGTEGAKRSELNPGNYKFKLVSAKPSPFPNEVGTTDIDLVVVEGPAARRHLFTKIPHPSVTKYAQQWAAILVSRLGGEQLAGEDLVDTLNRIAPTANAFTMDIIENNYTDKKTGEAKQGRPKAQFFSILAA